MSRLRAASIHLSISLLIAGSVLALLYFMIYPPPLFRAMGGNELALLIIGIDTMLGPLLTLIVFRSGKRGLKLDLTVIGTLQLAALAYGLHTLWLSRPVFILARDDIAYVMAATDIRNEDLAQAQQAQFSRLSWTGPVIARLKRPDNAADRDRLLDLNMQFGLDIQNLPAHYRVWGTDNADLLAKAEPLTELRDRKPEAKARIDAWLAAHDRTPEQVRYLHTLAFREVLCLLVDAQDGSYLGLLGVDPS